MQQIHLNPADNLDQIENALDAAYEAEAAAKMLIDRVAHLAGENATQRAATHLHTANSITAADEDEPPEPYLINLVAHRINCVSNALVEIVCGCMDNAAMPHDAEQSDLMDIEQAARYLRLHAGSLRRIASAGGIPARKIGREWRLSRQALQAWLACAPGTDLATNKTGSAPSLSAESASLVRSAIRQPNRS